MFAYLMTPRGAKGSYLDVNVDVNQNF